MGLVNAAKKKLADLKQKAANKIERQQKDAVVLSTRREKIKGADAKEKSYKAKKEKEEEAAYLAMMNDPVKLAAHLKKLTRAWMVAEVKMSSLRAPKDSSALDKVLISYRLATDQDKADKFLSKAQLLFKKRKRRMKLYARAKKKVFTYRMQTKTVVAQLETLARSNKLQGPLIRSQLMAARKAQETIGRVGKIALNFQVKKHAEKMSLMVKTKAAKEAQVSDPLAQLSHMIGSFDQVAGVWGSSMIAPPPPPPETFHGPNAKAAQQAVAGVKQATND